MDYSTLTDEQLDAMIAGDGKLPDVSQAPPGQGMVTLNARNAAATKLEEKNRPTEDHTRGMGAIPRFAAGFGSAIAEPVIGAGEKVQIAFPGDGDAGKANLQRIGAERTSRRANMADLNKTPAGQAGSFLGEALPAILAPATAGAQALLYGAKGFLEGGPDRPTGIGNELATSAVRGGLEGVTTAGVMTGAKALGKSIGAAAGQYTPQGKKAMELDDAAKRLGLPPLTIGQLDPSIQTKLPGYEQRVLEQADALGQAVAGRRQVPAATGKGTVEQVIPGGGLKQEMIDSVRVVQNQGSAKYKAVDDFVTTNGLGGVQPSYTFNTLSSINSKLTPKGGSPDDNIVYQHMMQYNPEVFAPFTQMINSGMTKQQLISQGIPMSAYHDLRVAAGKAMNRLQRAPTPTKETLTATKELGDLIKALDNDAERWATQNSGNKEAMDLYNNAKEFYSKVVVPATIENPVARKLTTRRTPYVDAQGMYSDLLATGKQEFVDRLTPTMSQSGQDALSVFRNVPDLGRTLLAREAPKAPQGGALESLLRTTGKTAAAASGVAPGLSWLSGTRPAKKLYFGRNTLGQGLPGGLTAMGAQYPQDGASEGVRKVLNLR